jgi:formamidopyrimidine-DNA glycosylase
VELPEVEVVRRDLEKDVVGKRIKDVEVRPTKNAKRVIRRHKLRKDFTGPLEGTKIARIERRGKYILFFLDSGDVMITNFGMSGQMLRGTKRQPMPPHTPRSLQQPGSLECRSTCTSGQVLSTTPG